MSGNNIQIKNFNLGHFLRIQHIEKAFALLQKQIKQKSYTFKTIDLEIYRKEKSIENFDCNKFYENYIRKDILYNYRTLFYNYEYNIPKGAYGIRKFNFTSFNLLILYYALGFYFYELLNEYLTKIEPIKRKLENIKTFYGGLINYDNPLSSVIYYQDDYASFNAGIKDNIQKALNKGNKVCTIKLDIQDFYGSINTNKLLKVIDIYSLPSSKKNLRFDNSTKQAISSLFLFLNKREYGLPLSAQNIISNFISYIFLFELDNFIQNLPIYGQEGFSYFRYVDDFFIIFCREQNVRNDVIGKEIFEMSSCISDFLSSELDLKINHLKSQNWIIENDYDYQLFLEKEKFISFADPFKNPINASMKPSDRLNEVCDIIQNLKDNFTTNGKASIKDHDDVALKEVFIESVRNFVKSSEAKDCLDKVFIDWEPILTLNSVKALMFLIGNSKTGFNIIKNYFETDLEIKIQKTQNIYLLEKFLNLEKYDNCLDKEILEINKNNSLYFSLIQRMIKGDNEIIVQYLPIDDKTLQENDSLTQQIKMMVLAEEEGKYNLAFNHLLNFFHFYCFIKDGYKTVDLIKNYDQNDIVNCLIKNNASIEDVNFVMSFFDRRNKNNISHSGDNLMANWVVDKIEFKSYYEQMVKLIKRKIH